jgi:protein TonB
MVSEAIQRHKRYPRMARRRELSGQVVLEFVILRNGQVTQARVIPNQSTRHHILHQAALRALKQANPLPPFPETLQKPSWRITLPILYELAER